MGRTGHVGIAVAYDSAPSIRRTWVHDTAGVGISVDRGCAGEIVECRVENTAQPAIQIAEGASTTIAAATSTARVGAVVDTRDDGAVDKLLAELDAMVGLAAVKAEVRSLIDEIQVNEWRRTAGLSVGAVSHHLIFAGAPGTGKTTVARLYGKLLKALRRAAERASFSEVSRRDLVGQYIGHTAEKTAHGVRAVRWAACCSSTRLTRCPARPAAAATSARRRSTRW